MTDSLKAELFRCRKDKFPLFAFILVTAGFIFMTFIARFAEHNDRVTIFTSGTLSQFYSLVKMAVFVLYFVWFQEYRYGTMKNLCMSDTTKGQYFTAKFLTQIIVCISLMVWTLICFSICYLTLERGTGDASGLIKESLLTFLRFTLFSVMEIAVIDLLFVITKNEIVSFLLFFIVLSNSGALIAQLAEKAGIGGDRVYPFTIGGAYDAATTLALPASDSIIFILSVTARVLIIYTITLLILRNEVNYEKKK